MRDTVTPGTRIDAGDLVVESVRLGSAADRYLVPRRRARAGRRRDANDRVGGAGARHGGRRGGSHGPRGRRRCRAGAPSRAGLGAGSTVDVWSARELDRGSFEPPAVLVANAEIAGIQEPEGMVDAGGVSVELLIPREKVAAVLEALAAGDAIDLVPSRAGGR